MPTFAAGTSHCPDRRELAARAASGCGAMAILAMIRDELPSHGIAAREEIEQHLEDVRARMPDLSQPPMISVRGRKPPQPAAAL